MNRKETIIFFSIVTLEAVASNLAHPVTPTLIKTLGLHDYMFGVAFAAMSTAGFLFSPFWGRLTSVLQERTCLLLTFLGYAMAQFLFMRSTMELQIILARFLAGMFIAGINVSILTYITRNTESEKTGVYLTFYATFCSVAGTIGYFIGGMIGDSNIYHSFLLQVLLLSLSGILFYCFLKPTATTNPASFKSLLRSADPFRAFKGIRTITTKELAFAFALTLLISLSMTCYDQTFNYYIKDVFNFKPSGNGTIKAVSGLLTLLVNSTVCLWIMRRKDIVPSCAWVCILCSVFLAVLINTGSLPLFLGLNFVYCACASICNPIMQDLCAKQRTEENSGAVMGFYNSMRSLGWIFGALIAGFLYALSPSLPFIISLVLFATTAVVCFLHRAF